MATARRVTCLLILLHFATWVSFARASQGGISGSNHRVLDDKHVATAATSKNLLGGRKMMALNKQMKKLKDVKTSGTTVEVTSKISSTNSKGCKQTVSHFSDEVDESRFVAFNADYHAPRHHPPKNN